MIALSATKHWNSQLCKSITASSITTKIWTRPCTGWLKSNSDCRFIDGISSSVFLIRNHNGSILLASATDYHCTNALVAELFAIRDACLFFNSIGLEKAVIESDSLNAITFINDPQIQVHWMGKQLVEEIRKFWFLWPKWSSNFVLGMQTKLPIILPTRRFLSRNLVVLMLTLYQFRAFVMGDSQL